jgi:hypothetical protein
MDYKKPIAVALVGTFVINANLSIFHGDLSIDLPPLASIANIAFTGSTGTYVPIYAELAVYNTVTDEQIDMPVPAKRLTTRGSRPHRQPLGCIRQATGSSA